MRLAYRTLLPALALIVALVDHAVAVGAADVDPLWPCPQLLVPAISAASIWDGPPIDGEAVALDGAHAQAVATLATELLAAGPAAAAPPPEDRIARFAAEQPDDATRNRVLAALFTTLLERTNAERHTVIEGIRKQAAGVNALAERMNALLARRGTVEPGSPEDAEMEKELYWLQRVFTERRRAQTYLCEAPVQREQRLGTLTRAILSELR